MDGVADDILHNQIFLAEPEWQLERCVSQQVERQAEPESELA